MTDKERIEAINEIAIIDDIAEKAGGYVSTNSVIENQPHYDYRAIIIYCKEKGIDPLDMTLRELNSFIVN